MPVGGGKTPPEPAGRPGLDEGQLDHVAAVIREASPDIACLQEVVDRAQAARLSERLGAEYGFAFYEDNYDRRAAMFVRGRSAGPLGSLAPGGRSSRQWAQISGQSQCRRSSVKA